MNPDSVARLIILVRKLRQEVRFLARFVPIEQLKPFLYEVINAEEHLVAMLYEPDPLMEQVYASLCAHKCERAWEEHARGMLDYAIAITHKSYQAARVPFARIVAIEASDS